jgi:putative acetyltransferase
MIIRRERTDDVEAIRAVTAAAFRDAVHSAPPVEPDGVPGEATLVSWLRQDPGWIPRLSLVAVEQDVVLGHVVATRGRVGAVAALGLGPVSVAPRHQRAGIGTGLVHAVLGAAEALDEPLVALLGDPLFYARFGFVPGESVGITPPDPAWGDHFQVRHLTGWTGATGEFRFAAPFERL